MQIQKLESESEFEHKIRLIKLKLVDKYDIEWQEIVDTLKLDCSADHLRKTSYGILEATNYFENKLIENISDDALLKEYEIKKRELEKERKKMQATNIEYNRNNRIDGKFELLYENIRDAIFRLTPPSFECIKQNVCQNKEYILQFSDVHFGAKFKSEKNEYSRQICKERFDLLLEKTVEIIEKENITNLIVLNNADSLQGLLRISDVRMNDIPVVEAVVEFSQMMATWLNALSKYVNVKYLHVSSANHMELRLLGTSAGQMANEDLEKIIINYIHDVLVNNARVEVPVTNKPYIGFNICGFDAIAIHGHQIKNIENSLRDFSMLHKKFYSFVFMGHYHNGRELTVGEGIISGNAEVLVSPPIVGSCPYADSLFVGGKSMAKLHVIGEKEGRLNTYNLLLN